MISEIQNFSGVDVWVVTATGSYLLPSASSLPVESGTVGSLVDSSGSVGFEASTSLVVVGQGLTLSPVGGVPGEMLGAGFSLGLAVACAMLLLWIARLLRKPVAES